jgi:hypothetical protein
LTVPREDFEGILARTRARALRWTSSRQVGKSSARSRVFHAASRNPTQKADSEIFNKFGRSIESGRCTMRNHDFVSDGFLALIVASLLLLCSSLLVIAFS